MTHTLIVGCGDIGHRVAARFTARGEAVTGWVRSTSSAEALERAHIESKRVDLDKPGDLPAAGGGDERILYLAPPPREGGDDPRLRRFLRHLKRPRRLVYISTSGVYGDHGGDWVNEDTPLEPSSARGKRRVAAECRLRHWSHETGATTVILRVPGIYGPGRLPVQRLKRGQAVLRREDSGYVNRIHADDLAMAAVVAAEQGRARAVYNVSDDYPAAMCDYFDCVADALGLPRPPRVNWAQAQDAFSGTALSFLRDSKRLCNRRLREDLGVRLRYPDFRRGVAACVAENH